MDNRISDKLHRVADRSTLRLTHSGRKSGKPYQVTIWFIVDGEKILLTTANIDRNWVRNVRKTAHVEFAIGTENFAGTARFLESESDRGRVLAMVKRKYWIATPMLALSRLFAALGAGASNFGAFEVTLSA
ncbi:MAG TPA: nitroreductase family deazaflavin-dependent oxidoreductase [Candidatus Binataceae bacterium]|nr:nitroreductase family deazaflavin-dependent oxidoreductase [Candidatus Binataceae bacterium]